MTACAALALFACAEAPQTTQRKPDAGPLVFPSPPDAPRFVYERTIYSSGDVIAEQKDSALRRLLTGEGAQQGERFSKPYAIAVHQGRIFVSDSVDRFVRVFDVPSGRHFKIGQEDPGALAKPLGIDVDKQGRLYVADVTQGAILIYDRDGKFQRKIGSKQFDRLASVTVDPGGDRVYAVDIGGVWSRNHHVRVFNATSGAHLFDIGTRGNGPGQLNLPRDVAVGKDGRLYVVDAGNFRITVFDRDGKFLRNFGEVGMQFGNFARPKEIATDAAGNVYVIDTAFANFQIFDSEGTLLMFVGQRGERDAPARYMLPSGIFVDEDGRIYVVDQWFRKVEIFRPVGIKAEGGYLNRRPVAKPAAR